MLNTDKVTGELALHVVKQFHIPYISTMLSIIQFTCLQVNLCVYLAQVDVRWPGTGQYDLLSDSNTVRHSKRPKDLIKGKFKYDPVFISEDSTRECKLDLTISIVGALTHNMYLFCIIIITEFSR